MRKLIVLALVLCFGLIPIAANAQHQGITIAKDLSSSPLDAEAKIQATKVFDGLVTKCGDNYYMWNDQGGEHGWAIEFREKPVLTVGSLPVGEMQKMNGLEWTGLVSFQASADKIHWPSMDWSWGWGSHSFRLSKINGAWVYISYMGNSSPSGTFSDNIPCEKATAPPSVKN